MKSLFLHITLLLMATGLFAQNVTIKGNASDYVGEELIFYKFKDQITYSEEVVAKCVVQENGDFSCSATINETMPLFLPFETFKGYLYVEPDSTYEIALPSGIEKNENDKRNPFFKPVDIDLGIINTNNKELNFLIRSLDASYNLYISRHYHDLMKSGHRQEVDTVIMKFNSFFSGISNQYFNDYKDYKLGTLKQMAYRLNGQYTAKEFLLNKPVLYNNDSYMSLFNETFENYLSNYSKTSDGIDILNIVNYYKSFRRLKKTLQKDISLSNDTLKELVILKGLHDGYYADEFRKKSVLQLLDSVYYQTTIPQHKEIARNIIEKTTLLKEGTDAPKFQLMDRDSQMVTLDDFQGKYTYLTFGTTWSYASRLDFELLNRFHEKYGDAVQFVTIIADDEFSRMTDFLSQNSYNWTFLHYGAQKDILKDYNVRIYPTYYLITPDGRLSMSPANSPSEDIESTFKLISRPKVKIEHNKGLEDLFNRPKK